MCFLSSERQRCLLLCSTPQQNKNLPSVEAFFGVHPEHVDPEYLQVWMTYKGDCEGVPALLPGLFLVLSSHCRLFSLAFADIMHIEVLRDRLLQEQHHIEMDMEVLESGNVSLSAVLSLSLSLSVVLHTLPTHPLSLFCALFPLLAQILDRASLTEMISAVMSVVQTTFDNLPGTSHDLTPEIDRGLIAIRERHFTTPQVPAVGASVGYLLDLIIDSMVELPLFDPNTRAPGFRLGSMDFGVGRSGVPSQLLDSSFSQGSLVTPRPLPRLLLCGGVFVFAFFVCALTPSLPDGSHPGCICPHGGIVRAPLWRGGGDGGRAGDALLGGADF